MSREDTSLFGPTPPEKEFSLFGQDEAATPKQDATVSRGDTWICPFCQRSHHIVFGGGRSRHYTCQHSRPGVRIFIRWCPSCHSTLWQFDVTQPPERDG